MFVISLVLDVVDPMHQTNISGGSTSSVICGIASYVSRFRGVVNMVFIDYLVICQCII